MSNYAIGLDVHDMSAPVSLNVKQGESGQIINISLRSGGKPYLLPSGAYAVFAGKKPDGKILWNSCQVVRHTIQYEITKQTTAVVGWVPVQIRIYKPDGKLLLTPDFVLIVDAPVAGDEEVIAVSENEITALTELVSEAATMQKAVFWAEYGTTTYAEIKAARDEGQVVLCRMTGSALVLNLHSVEQFGAHFTSFKDGYNPIWSVSTEDVWSVKTDEYPTKDEVPELVKFTAEYGVTTLDEILEAKAAGKVIVCVRVKGGAEIPLYSAGETGGRNAYFSAFLDGYNVAYFCGSAGWSDLSSSYAETPLKVTISGTAASHSASEIIAAIKAEKIVEVNMGTERLQVTAWDESAVTVTCKKAPAPDRSRALLSCNEYTISDDKTWAVVANSAISNKFTAKAGQVVAVANADPRGPTDFKAIDLREEFIATYGTTTFAEIWDAMRANKAVYCKNGNVTLPMTVCRAQSLVAEFGGVTESGSVVWKVKSATWSSEVLVDEDKFVAEYGVSTYAEIYSAMKEGKSVFCKNGYYEFPMVKFTAPSWTAYFGGMADGRNVTFKVQGETWSSYNTELNDDCVKTVNGIAPDARGNVQIETGGGGSYVLPIGGENLGGVKNGGNVVINADGTMTAPESSGGVVASVEPADDDMPKVFFVGKLPTAKSEGELKGSFEYISKTEHINGYCTLKVQGDTSTGYPKKNFTMKTYSDEACETKVKHDFKSWGKLNKFVLKAHWVDPSHIRNVGCAKLWGQMVRSRNDFSSLPVELQNSPNNGATDGFTVKFYANGIYQGMYEWIVPKDKLFGQDSDIATHSIMNSELNNSPTCAFATINPAIAGNWSEELQDSMSSDISASFTNFIKFVAGSTDAEFVANAENYFDVRSVIDYDIFARVICAMDCICKNQIFFTYDGVKWYEGAWDLDLVLGNAGGAYNTKFQQGYIPYKSHGIINMLYMRVEKLFETEFKQRYAELRKTVLTAGNIINIFERLSDVITAQAGLYAEDKASTTADGAFTTAGDGTGSIITIRNFIAKRLVYMDGSIANLNQLTVTYNLTNVSSDNTVETVEAGSSYIANLTTEDGYTISEIVVTMGGVDVTETVYVNGVITIDNVTDDITIRAVAITQSTQTYEYFPDSIITSTGDGEEYEAKIANGDVGYIYSHDIEVTAGQTITITCLPIAWQKFMGNRYIYDARKFMSGTGSYKQVASAEYDSELTVTLTATASGTLVVGGFYNSANGYTGITTDNFVGKYIRVTVTG